MLCRKPFRIGNALVGCGQCIPCRVNRRRTWTVRQVLESWCHDENAFVTLTYAESELPEDRSVRPRELRLFLGRFRERMRERDVTGIRFFGVGEYGDETGRPHYHLSLFGVGPWCSSIVSDAWKKGFVYVGDFTRETAQYVAKYAVKRMTVRGDARLEGRAPEFMRCSRRPGIGAPAMAIIAEQLHTDFGLDVLARGDVPMEVRAGKRRLPLGRFLRSKLREECGFPEWMLDEIKENWQKEQAPYVLALQEAARNDASYPTVAAQHVKARLGAIRNVEARDKLTKKGAL